MRSDNVRALTDAGWHSLAEHGVQRIVDLRFPEELAEDAPRDVDIEVVHVSVLGDSFDQDYVAELDAHLQVVDDVADHYAWSYVDFLERYRDRFGRCVRRRSRMPTGRSSCTAWAARTARVSWQACSCVWPVSTARRSAPTTRCRRAISPLRPAMGRSGCRRAPSARSARSSQHTPAEGMVRTLEEIERRYGDVASYLRAAGLDDAQIERLRDRLVAP